MVIDEHIEKFLEEYGDILPNPEHFPQTFMFYVKLYKSRIEREMPSKTVWMGRYVGDASHSSIHGTTNVITW